VVIIPAVDIKGGKCVRLEQGLMNKETIFSNHPEEMALEWESKGAERLHLVDLDGAVRGRPSNQEAIEKVVHAVSVPVQLGGGIRELGTIEEYINLGVDRVIVGTTAYKNPELIETACKRYPGSILISIDARDNYVSVEGWTEGTGIMAIDLAGRFEDIGVSSIVYTDIKRDGMRTGPNVDAIRKFARAISIPVIAAGGISSLKDIGDLLPLEEDGVRGVIIGRALYDGSLKLEAVYDMLHKRGG
jgi:phosphoribosylformimino-5-aminoimidazole carboxamide ribotide isomerase